MTTASTARSSRAGGAGRALKSPLAVHGDLRPSPAAGGPGEDAPLLRDTVLSDRAATLAEFEDYLRTTNSRDGRPYEEAGDMVLVNEAGIGTQEPHRRAPPRRERRLRPGRRAHPHRDRPRAAHRQQRQRNARLADQPARRRPPGRHPRCYRNRFRCGPPDLFSRTGCHPRRSTAPLGSRSPPRASKDWRGRAAYRLHRRRGDRHHGPRGGTGRHRDQAPATVDEPARRTAGHPRPRPPVAQARRGHRGLLPLQEAEELDEVPLECVRPALAVLQVVLAEEPVERRGIAGASVIAGGHGVGMPGA